MPTYKIDQYELHAKKYRVEAASAAEAIAKLFAGEAEPVEQSRDFIEVANDYGLPVDEYPELAAALQNLGVMRGNDETIPSIRSIEEVGDEHPMITVKSKKEQTMKTTLTCDIEYDPELTDPEGLASAMDRLLETVLSTPGIMEEYGDPKMGEFFVAKAAEGNPKPGQAIEAVGAHDSGADSRRRWVLYDLDTDCLLSTRAYDTHQEAADDAFQVNDVLILQVVIQGIAG